MSLPSPGDIIQLDFRSSSSQLKSNDKSIRLLQWNIERGYKLSGIIEELKAIDADILSLQEVDIGCDRSQGKNCGIEIARALGLNYVFLSEFEELRSSRRDERSQGGGIHGNCILTKYDIADVSLVPHRHHPVDWNDPSHPRAQQEPRKGQRAVLRATINTPQGPLLVYCAHLEVFCGMLARIRQLSDIFADSKTMIDKGYYHQALLGDLNTMAHGIARFSPKYCCDKMRFRSLGHTEAKMWQKYVIEVVDSRYIPIHDGASKSTKTGSDAIETRDDANPHLLRWGIDAKYAADALNPGFICPFDHTTITLDNPKYRLFGVSLMRGKLDWMLLRRIKIEGKDIGNLKYEYSDHRWLSCDVQLD